MRVHLGLIQAAARPRSAPRLYLVGGRVAPSCSDGPAGSECVYLAVTYPHVAGTWVMNGGLGTSCAGIGGLPCDAALVCKVNAIPGMSDPMGICSKP